MNSLQFSSRRYLYTNFEFWNFPPAVGSAESPDGPGGPGLSVGRAATRHGQARPRAPTLQEKRRPRAELPPLFDISKLPFPKSPAEKVVNLIDGNFTLISPHKRAATNFLGLSKKWRWDFKLRLKRQAGRLYFLLKPSKVRHRVWLSWKSLR